MLKILLKSIVFTPFEVASILVKSFVEASNEYNIKQVGKIFIATKKEKKD